MKATIIATAAALGVASALVNGAAAAPRTQGSWSFTDYTADPASLAADDMLHAATGSAITSYCHGSRIPSAPQDVTSHALTVSAPAVLHLHISSTGAWGLDVNNQHGTTLADTATAPGGAGDLSIRLPKGRYTVASCNLGGAPTANVAYTVTPAK